MVLHARDCRALLQQEVHQVCRAHLPNLRINHQERSLCHLAEHHQPHHSPPLEGVPPYQGLTAISHPDQGPQLQRRRLAKTRVAPQAETLVVLQARDCRARLQEGEPPHQGLTAISLPDQ